MRVMGLDPGSHVAGFALLERSSSRVVTLVASGRWRLGTDPKHVRLGALYDYVTGVIHQHWPVNVVVIEDGFVGPHARSALIVGYSRGVCMAAAGQFAGVKVELVVPSVAKKSVARGNASKHEVQGAVRALLRMERAPPEDEADAIALAWSVATRGRQVQL